MEKRLLVPGLVQQPAQLVGRDLALGRREQPVHRLGGVGGLRGHRGRVAVAMDRSPSNGSRRRRRSEAPQVSAAPEGGGRRVCETIHNMANPARIAPDPQFGALRRTTQFLAGTGPAYIWTARDPCPHPCSSPSRSSGTGRSGSPWWAAAASRPTTSTPSSGTQDRAELVGGLRHRSRGPGRAEARTGAPGFRTLDALLAGTDADIVILAHAERPARRPGHPGGRGRPARDDREADGHPLAGRQADGPGLRPGRRAPVRGQAEPAERHPAAGEAGGGEEAVRPDLHGQHQRVLEPARSPTTTARPGAAPGSSTAARS